MGYDLERLPRRFYKDKYNSKSCRCHQGHQHDSRYEAGYCDQLYILKQAGDVQEIEIQKKFSFDINGVHIANYYADFFVTDKEGVTCVHETKGFKTADYIIKRQLFKALYPDIPFYEIK